MSIHQDAQTIIRQALKACLPDQAVRRALEEKDFGPGKLYLVAAGKAAWQMARCAADLLGDRLQAGVVVTKHGHSMGNIPHCAIWEGGHPVPDEGSFRGTQAAIDLVSGLTAEDTVIFLVSGGGSALFERPLVPAEDLSRLLSTLERERLGCRRILPLCPRAGEAAKRVLVLARKDAAAQCRLEAPLPLHDGQCWSRGALAFCPWLGAGHEEKR